jgi:hypothetical protein
MPIASWLKLDECAGRKNDQQGYHPDGSACPKGHGAKAEQQQWSPLEEPTAFGSSCRTAGSAGVVETAGTVAARSPLPAGAG